MMATVIRVLYVDDEPSLLELAKVFLERYGDFAVTVATSAAEAIRILRQERFDTIVSDYQMPDMDGIAFLRHLKAEGNTTPFIIFTGKGREEVVIEAFNAGADFYIQKGGEAKSQFAELVHKVQRAVQHHIDEKALLESEVRFRALVENASDIIRILNRDGRIVFDTAASSRQLGYPSGYTLGRDPFEFIHPDDLALVKEEFSKIYAKTNNGVPTEFRIRKADGSYIWVESIGKNLIGVPGIDGVVITTRFIDERKRAEAERRESEEKFRQLFSGMPSGVAIYEAVLHGEDFVFRDFNAAAEAIEHIKKEEVIGRRVTEVFPGVKEFGIFSVFQRVLRTGQPEFFPTAVYRDASVSGAWRENWIYRLPTGEIVAIYNDVSERKTAEDALHESEKQYHSILDSMQDGYIRADAKGHIIMASPSAARLFRYDSASDLIGLSAASLYRHPKERQEIIRIVKERGEVHDFICEGVRKDGSGLWASMNVQFTFDSKGRVTGTDGFVRDITDRKQAEEALKKSEAYYRALFENTGTASVIIEEDATISLANEGFAVISGYPREEIEGKIRWTEFVVKEDLERMLAQHRLRRKDRTLAERNYEFRFVRKSGEIRTIFLSVDVISGTKKSIASLLDITDYKNTEQALRESEERYRAVVEDQTEFICRFTADGRLTFVNDAYCRYFSLDKDMCLAHPHSVVLPPEDARLMRQHLVSLTPENPVATVEHRIIMPSGEVRWQQWNDRAIFDLNGHVVEYQSVGRDTTDIKKAEDAFRESEKQYHSILDNMQDAYVRADAKGHIIMASPSAARLFRYDSVNDLIGLPAASLYRHPKERQEIIRIVKEQGEVHDYICEGMRKDGSGFWVSMNVQFTFDSKGRVTGSDGFIRDITERKASEQALIKSQIQLAEAMDLANLVNWEFDVASGIFTFNDRFYALYGTTAEREGGYQMPAEVYAREFVHPDEVGVVADEVQKAITATDPNYTTQIEHRIIRRDGAIRHIIVRYGITKDAEGRTVKTHGANQDITERKRAEEELQNSLTFLNNLIDQSPTSMWISDENGTLIRINKACCDLLNISEMDVVGKYNILSDNLVKKQGFLPLVRDVFDKGQVAHFQITYDTGKLNALDLARPASVILDVTIFPVKDTHGKITNAVIQHINISDRKRVEEALRESEEQYRSLLEHVPELILVHKNGIILYTNPAAVKTLGYQPYEALNRQIIDFIAPEYHERVAAAVRRRMSGEPVEPYEIDVMSRDGSRRTMIINGCQIEFEGAPASLIVLVDITEQKVLHNAVRLANKKLNLLSNITRHDIVNQLLALNGYLELSREILDDPVKLAEFITKEQNIASTMQTQILFTKDYQDLGIHAPVWQNVHESVVNARENLPLRGIAVETDSPTLEVYADPLLVRVFYNLIDNALRYGGGQMTTIRISSQETHRGLVIVCEDDGVGIPADKKEAIFNRGYFKHTGFGLFLSREILAITGITIIENSTPGKGARFEITVPKGAYRFTGTKEK